MPLEPGSTLAHYEIVEPIGKGGMGEVFRAKDGKLGREVAIKVLPEEFARDAERLARFEREAKVLASLNHPNIAAIYGLERSGDTHYLVLELVPGETLAERIVRGPIPIVDTVEIASQIAEALEEAHERGIVHRDLKPANIKLTPHGKVKVLDFGLAKAFAGDDVLPELSQSPTISRHQTAAGVILGTAAYMSPEQARGKSVDKRSDIWSYGVVLFEMLTGKTLFDGATISDTLAAILKESPDWDSLPADTPRTVRELSRRCVEKDPRARLRDIGEARIALETGELEPEATSGHDRSGLDWRVVLPWGLVAAFFLVLAIEWLGDEGHPSVRVAHASIDLPEGGRLGQFGWGESAIAISPDGNLVATAVGSADGNQLYLHDLSRGELSAVPNTPESTQPFFSPNGKWLGFFQSRGRKLMKVAVDGAVPIELAESAPVGGTWAPDDTIIYTPDWNEGVWSVSAGGGTPKRLTTPNVGVNEIGHWYPHILPDGEHVLVNVYRSPIESAHIDVLSLETGEQRVLIEGGLYGRYASSGHIVYVGRDAVMAVAFDARRLRLVGLPVPVLSDVYMNRINGNAAFAFSDEGTLLYARHDSVSPDRQLVWVDRQGNVSPTSATLDQYLFPRLSPDGRKIAVTMRARGASDIWILDLERNTRARLSVEHPGGNQHPVWTSDSRRVLYASDRGFFEIVSKSIDDTSPAELIASKEQLDRIPYALSPDGASLLYERSRDNGVERDVWLMNLESGETSPLLEFVNTELYPVFSPDGNWLAYQSDESGQTEIYVQSFPNAERRQQVSTSGGAYPLWAPSGRELFYRNGDAMMAVEIQTDGRLEVGQPQALFEIQDASGGRFRNYDITPDGERFLMVQRPESTEHGRLEIVFNWFTELEQLAPSGN